MQSLNPNAIEAALHTRRFGRPLIAVAETASTNTLARQMAADGAPEGTAVVADRQTAGRGRRGRSFFSPTGGIYLSILLRPRKTAEPGLLTSCAAVATARAIERFAAFPVAIKWVNDLLIGGRKVCGILTEGDLDPRSGALRFAVLGIGINVAHAAFPPELQNIVTTLADEGCAVTREALIAALLEEWETAYATIDSGDFLTESRRRSAVLGRAVTVLRGTESFEAVAEDIGETGGLWVRRPGGERLCLCSGEVSLRL